MPATPCRPLVLECNARQREGAGAPGDGRAYFPQSVASGEPEAQSVLLWTRAVDPEHPGADVPLRLQVARDEHFQHGVLEAGELRTTSAHDHTLKVRLTRLEPCTYYYYRFVVRKRGEELGSPVGRTRTGVACAQERPSHFVVATPEELLGQERLCWQRLLRREEDPDFILFVGATLGESGGPAQPPTSHPVSRDRDLYRTHRSHPLLQQLHALYPFVVLWEEEQGGPDARVAERRRDAWLALLEYLPIDDARPGVEVPIPGEPAVRPPPPRASPPGVMPRRASRRVPTPPGLRRRAGVAPQAPDGGLGRLPRGR